MTDVDRIIIRYSPIQENRRPDMGDLRTTNERFEQDVNEVATKYLERYITHVYGKRCRTRDLDDFPEMEHDPLATRCRACLEWERYDEWVKQNG